MTPMNEQVAQGLIKHWLAQLRQQSYQELARLIGHPQTRELGAEDGQQYQLEAEAVWDRENGGDLRVMVACDDGGLRAFRPLTDSFIMAPDGSFVGE